jgi:hypothetical protein
MHREHAGEELICMSVCVSDVDDKAAALAFLKKQQAVIENYLLDEKTEVWMKLLEISGPPAVLVFDRSGKKVKTFTSEETFTYADVEKFIEPLLKDKK